MKHPLLVGEVIDTMSFWVTSYAMYQLQSRNQFRRKWFVLSATVNPIIFGTALTTRYSRQRRSHRIDFHDHGFSSNSRCPWFGVPCSLSASSEIETPLCIQPKRMSCLIQLTDPSSEIGRNQYRAWFQGALSSDGQDMDHQRTRRRFRGHRLHCHSWSFAGESMA